MLNSSRSRWIALAGAFGLGAVVGSVVSHIRTARQQNRGRRRQRTIDTNPKALLNYAREYLKASEVVFNSEPRLTMPLNYVYFHTLELLLKSFLLASGERLKTGHEIHKLYKKALKLGLKIPGDPLALQNIVGLLQAGNIDQAFRYGTSKGTSEPTVAWTREVLAKLMQAVEAFVDPNPSATPGEAAKLTMVFGTPVPKSE